MIPLQEALDELDNIVAGIDEDETDGEGGWWPTSTGVEFGAAVKEELIALIRKIYA
jgi:hypothetical protein